jgi:carbohydrate kinase (thermoresistant glucokinase family)
MHSAHPLDARDQWSWLAKVAAWIDGCRQLGTGGVITCSALRRSYRDFLTRGRPEVRVVYLHGERPLIEERLATRKEHSMLPDILDRHFAILEEPDPDEDPIVVDVSRPVEDIVAEILRELAPRMPEDRLAVMASDSTERPANPLVKPSGPQSHPGTDALPSRGRSIRSDLPLDVEDYALIIHPQLQIGCWSDYPRSCRWVCRRVGIRRAAERRNRSPRYLRETRPRALYPPE